MATRLYFPASAPLAGLTPAFDAGWNDTSEAERHQLVRAKGSSALTIGTRVGPWSGTAGQRSLDRQWVSAPLAAQTISGTVSAMAMVREYATSDNVDRPIMAIKVCNSSGSIVATLLTIGAQTGSATTEFVNNATHRTCTYANGASLTSYACADGDRIVVELGYSNNGSGTSPEASTRWGDDSAGTDATVGDNATTADRLPWVEFSGTISFLAPTITSVTPDNGIESGGTSVTVAGEGFVYGMSFTVGGSNATGETVTGTTSCAIVTPSGSPGAADVVGTNPDTSTTGTSGAGAFTYTTAPQPITTITATGATVGRAHFGGYDVTNGWPDLVGAQTAIQNTVARKPSSTTTPGGDTAPSFDNDAAGSENYLVATGTNPNYPTWATGHHQIVGIVARMDSNPSTGGSIVAHNASGGINDDTFEAGNANGISYQLFVGNAFSNGNVVDSTVHRIIIVRDGATGTTTIYIDGTAQTATASTTLGTQWRAGPLYFGCQDSSVADRRIIGATYGYIEGYSTAGSTPFDSTLIAALDSALDDWYQNGATPAVPPIEARAFEIELPIAHLYRRDRLVAASGISSGAINTPFTTSIDFPASGSAAAASFTADGVAQQAFVASGSAAFTSFTADGVADIPMIASGSADMSSLAGTGSADESYLGSGAGLFASFTADGAGDQSFLGSGTGDASPLAGSGDASESYLGTGSAAATPLAGSGSADESYFGSGSAAASTLAASGVADESYIGSGTANASSFTASGVGDESYLGSGTADASSLAASGSGEQSYLCSGEAALASLSASGSGALGGGVFGDAAFASLTGLGDAVQTFLATGSASLASLAAAGNGSQEQSASGSAAAAPATASGNASQAQLATGAASFSSLTATGSAILLFSADGTGAFVPLLATGAGAAGVVASGSAAFSPFEADGTSLPSNDRLASGSASLSSFAADGLAAHIIVGSGSGTVSPFAADGAGGLSNLCSGGAVFASLTADGAAFLSIAPGNSTTSQSLAVAVVPRSSQSLRGTTGQTSGVTTTFIIRQNRKP